MHLGNHESSEKNHREYYENFCLEVIQRIGVEPWPCQWLTEVRDTFQEWRKSKIWPQIVHAMIENLLATKGNLYGPLFELVESYLEKEEFQSL